MFQKCSKRIIDFFDIFFLHGIMLVGDAAHPAADIAEGDSVEMFVPREAPGAIAGCTSL
jgi:hypothetical protein